MELLLVEGNPQSLIAIGYPAYARNFKETLGALDPTIGFSVAAPFESPLREADLTGIDGVVFTGSSIAAAMDAPECNPQQAAMELVFEHGIPTWGSCAGLQLAATVLGGAIGASPNGVEVGLAKELTLTEAGRWHAMMAGRPTQAFAVPCIHRDEVQRLPNNAELLAWNTHCPVQAFAYCGDGVDFWGAQYHPELAPSVIADGVRRQQGCLELAALLDRAETDDGAMQALGGSQEALTLRQRSLELSNWLDHVRSRSAHRQDATAQQ